MLATLKRDIDALLTKEPDLLKTFESARKALADYTGSPSLRTNEIIPAHQARLMSGKLLQSNLLSVINHAHLYTATDNPRKVVPFQERIDKVIQSVKTDQLYAITAQKMDTIHPATAHELTIALVNLYFDIKKNGKISPNQINFVV